MTEPVNGRVSQRDLYNAITRVEAKMDRRFDQLDERIRCVERQAATKAGEDELLAEQHKLCEEEVIGRRWLISIAAGVIFSVVANLISLAALMS